MHRRAVMLAGIATTAAAVVVLTSCSSGGSGESADGDVTIEFAQWWEPELPDGEFRALIDDFEAANPGITVDLVSGPYASTKEQLFAGAASGTMPDVVGLDGAWVNDFASQGVIADLSTLMADSGYDDSELASQVQVDGKTYMIPVVNFVYPMFTNDDLLAQAGIDAPPSTRSEFADAAEKVSALGDDASGWVLPLSLEAPNGVQNDVMSWVWASGGSMLADGQPDLTNDDVTSATEFIGDLWDSGAIASGSFTMKEQDKVEEFTNGRVGMMIDSLAHINLIRETNPDLKFSISAIPAEDDYTGERGIPYASWGIGVAENSEHKDAAFKLVSYLMSEETNSKLSTMANAFPGNTKSVPEFVADDDLFATAFEIYKAGYPANEFTGLPVAEELMRQFGEQFQAALDGQQSIPDALEKAQTAWTAEF
ncbi:sugar ABC transporter substrate-binding protein [Microbacterium sp. cx-55]|uniref:ABC transporter substrate-binding protein n=1 Tax=unclassified Microbacterium TaxID=2609290 RepID=UPI001CC0890A|nr:MULTISPECIES: sugar ABC transporter substrate-binding protein [unclassified Microbacterium]MBZ4487722.1 sugar ABC transporter substrate-binding protein [Microbacterium sp. cx-55]MCC4908127.1 sugar ABC transporter substrate-binding protein [Microbacterium sp. cx-59]UGB35732.1 sugar ABC transporter substrate-binding protein [Microbacterium sp. cx-55]